MGVLEYVAANPGSTAGDVALALGLNRNSVATRLTQLSKRGELVKAPRGYSAAYANVLSRRAGPPRRHGLTRLAASPSTIGRGRDRRAIQRVERAL